MTALFDDTEAAKTLDPEAHADKLPSGRDGEYAGLRPYKRRFEVLKAEAEPYMPLWRQLNEFMYPWSGRYLWGDKKSRDRVYRGEKIRNSVVYEAVRTCASGLHGGLTSPAKPWFEIQADSADEQVVENNEVKEWLHAVQEIEKRTLARSNFYAAMPEGVYAHALVYGTAAGIIDPDPKTGILVRSLTIGEYFLANGPDLRPNTLYRRFQMTASQLRGRFGEGNDGFSEPVRKALEEPARLDDLFDVVHAIQPIAEFGGKHNRRFQYESVYFLENADPDLDGVLEWQQHRTMPFFAVRWATVGDDVYGFSPGMMALADDKMLQTMEKDYLTASQMVIKPPLTGPNSLEKYFRDGGIEAGEFVPDGGVGSAQGGVRALHQVNYDFNNTRLKIDDTSKQIRQKFYNDLFLSILFNTKQMTATEVAQRLEEKAMVLGPVLERFQAELFDPILDRVYSILNHEFNVIPFPPDALFGRDPVTGEPVGRQNLNIIYIGQLAQSVKMLGLTNITNAFPIIQALLAIDPSAAKKFNVPELVDYVCRTAGFPPKAVRTDREYEAMLAAEAQAMQQANQMAQIQGAADTAKSLSGSSLDGNNALTALMGGMEVGNVA